MDRRYLCDRRLLLALGPAPSALFQRQTRELVRVCGNSLSMLCRAVAGSRRYRENTCTCLFFLLACRQSCMPHAVSHGATKGVCGGRRAG